MRFGIVPFSDPPFRVGARGVEVAQRDRADSVRHVHVPKHVLDHELRAAIGAYGVLRMALVERQAQRIAVGRAGGGKDERVDARAPRGLKEGQRARHVVPVEGQRFTHRHADLDECREMHDRDRAMLCHDRVEPLGVEDIAPRERSPAHELLMPVGKIVVDHGQEARLVQRQAGMRADIARAARNQHARAIHGVGHPCRLVLACMARPFRIVTPWGTAEQRTRPSRAKGAQRKRDRDICRGAASRLLWRMPLESFPCGSRTLHRHKAGPFCLLKHVALHGQVLIGAADALVAARARRGEVVPVELPAPASLAASSTSREPFDRRRAQITLGILGPERVP